MIAVSNLISERLSRIKPFCAAVFENFQGQTRNWKKAQTVVNFINILRAAFFVQICLFVAFLFVFVILWQKKENSEKAKKLLT